MNFWVKKFNDEAKKIKFERIGYTKDTTGERILDYLSAGFQFVGFVALILVFFTDITLVQATCFFVIGYTIAPTYMELSSNLIKQIAEDIIHIRINTKIGNYKEDLE
ncbi:MAG: hypothetical protein ACWGHH_07695 [Sulfurovaceae bacterium]